MYDKFTVDGDKITFLNGINWLLMALALKLFPQSYNRGNARTSHNRYNCSGCKSICFAETDLAV